MSKPLYMKVADSMRADIVGNVLSYGSRLPSEQQFAEYFGVDRKTLRRAIALLCDEGMLVRFQGKGTYIAERRVDYDVVAADDVDDMLRKSEMQPSSRVLYRQVRRAGRKYGAILGIDADEQVFRLVRLRLGNGEPVALQDSYIPLSVAPDAAKVDYNIYSIYGLLRRLGYEINRIDESFYFLQLGECVESKLLATGADAVVFVAEDTTLDSSGRVLEYTRSMINSGKMSIGARLINS